MDGESHYVVWAKMASNKRKETMFEAYSGAVQKFGHPLRIRSDYAGEHVLVERDIVAARPGVYRAYLTGSSVHNQVSMSNKQYEFLLYYVPIPKTKSWHFFNN